MIRFARSLIAALALLGAPWSALAQGQGSSAGAPAPGQAVATFAAGCFWCTEADFDKVSGVISTTSGFMGGTTPNPTYEQVVRGNTGHAEVVRVIYDPAKVSYEKLLDTYWHNVDPFDATGQFCDKGNQYRPEIFVHTPEQRKLAEASKQALVNSGRFKQPIVVKISDTGPFTAADDKHQDFYKKNPGHYSRYRTGCGRDARLEQIWGKAATQ
jgi:methionine-S-sulfoxide reductase